MRARVLCFCGVALAFAGFAAPVQAAPSDLVVAVDPVGATVRMDGLVSPTSASPTAASATPEPDPGPKPVAVAMSLYAMTGSANDDFGTSFKRDVALMGRLALEVYASFAVEDVRVLLGGSTLAIEAFYYANRSGAQFPALIVVGARGRSWLVAAAGGVSLASSDNAGAFYSAPDEEAYPSPRAELRAGYRARDAFEVSGLLGLERRFALDGFSQNRFFMGVSAGVGGDL